MLTELLEHLNAGKALLPGSDLSKLMNVTASQIRQDLNCFGGFGQQGYGYNVEQLYDEIGKILGVNEKIDTIIIGVGNLGKAIALHMDFEKRGFHLIGVFDKNPELENNRINDVSIYNINKLESFCKENNPKVAIICTPSETTEIVIDMLVKNGITGFWNYSHYDILAKYPHVQVQNVHLSDGLLTLGYQMKSKS